MTGSDTSTVNLAQCKWGRENAAEKKMKLARLLHDG